MAGLLIVERFTLEHHVLYSIAYTVSNLRSWKERTRSRSKTVCAPGEHAKPNDVLRVRDNRINYATPLVIMLSLHMHQLVKSMVNWNI